MRIGVDLGATEIEAVALDGAGAVRARRRVATPGGDSSGVRRRAWLWPPETPSQILPCPGGGPG